MLPERIESTLNDQIKSELESAYLYFSMSAYFEAENLPGFAHWMRVQAKEEFGHVMRYYDYINDRGGRIKLQALGEPEGNYNGPRDVFEKVLAHERSVTKKIHEFYELAAQEKDHPTEVFLQWFINEQVEEEGNPQQILSMIERVGETGPGLLTLDQQLGRRAAEG